MGKLVYPERNGHRRTKVVIPKPKPHWVCHECGSDKCKQEPWGGTTWNMGRCDLCQQNKPVAELRDFGGMK